MVVGICTLEFHLPGCRSLKTKRKFLNRLKGRLRSRFNVAVSEVEHQDLWQRALVGVVSVSGSRQRLDATFQKVLRDVEVAGDGHLVRFETEYL
ncbi:MAG: DUF503 domain-containing protein [Acidobacteriota bacterium]